MDLTHETYVHSDSIGHDAILDTPFDVTHTERTATMTRWMIDIEPPPFWGKQLGKPGRVDRWQIVTFRGAGGRGRRRRRGAGGDRRAAGRPFPRRQRRLPRGARAGDRDELPLFLEFRAHVQARRRAADARSAARPRQRWQGRIRSGSCVLEAQQRAIDKNPRQPFYNLNIDAGALWARRMIDRMLAREQARSAPGQAAE